LLPVENSRLVNWPTPRRNGLVHLRSQPSWHTRDRSWYQSRHPLLFTGDGAELRLSRRGQSDYDRDDTLENQENKMSDFSVRRMGVGALLLAGAVLATACEDKRVKELDTGISRDSALSVMGKGVSSGAPDSLPNIYLHERYLIAGQHYETMYFTPDDKKHNLSDTSAVNWKKLTPVVFREGKLIGRGWSYWDSVSTANKIPLKKR
jgi:hypothetical protein